MGNRKWLINVFYLINILTLDPGSAVILQYIQTRKSISLNLFWKIVSRLFLDRPPRKATTVFQLEMLQKTNYFLGWNVARKTHQIIVWSKPFTFARGKVRSVVGWWTLLFFFYFYFLTFAWGQFHSVAGWWKLLVFFIFFISFIFHLCQGEDPFHGKTMDTFEQN